MSNTSTNVTGRGGGGERGVGSLRRNMDVGPNKKCLLLTSVNHSCSEWGGKH